MSGTPERYNRKLTILNLAGNNVEEEGVAHLTKQRRRKLCVLNGGDKGVKHLNGALQSANCKLTELGLPGRHDEWVEEAARLVIH